jgi:hypothetical protein
MGKRTITKCNETTKNDNLTVEMQIVEYNAAAAHLNSKTGKCSIWVRIYFAITVDRDYPVWPSISSRLNDKKLGVIQT